MVAVPTALDMWNHVGSHLMETQRNHAVPSLRPKQDSIVGVNLTSTSLDATRNTNTTPWCLNSLHAEVPIIGVQCPRASHYCKDEEGQLYWEPLNHCKLAPPETFWAIASCSAVKGTGMGIVFWTKLGTPSSVWMDNTVITFTVSQTAVSAALLVHKAWSMPGFVSWWDHSQCWGLILSTSAWSQNFVLYFYKWAGSKSITSWSTVQGQGSPNVNDDKITALHKKSQIYIGIAAGTLLAFVIFNGIFTITNLIPAMFCFFWMPLAVARIAVFVFSALGRIFRFFWPRPEEDGEIYRIADGSLQKAAAREEEVSINFGPMQAIPLAVAFDVCIQWLAVASVHWYEGLGYLCAAWVATSERRWDVYFQNFVVLVLGTPVWLSVLINQLLP